MVMEGRQQKQLSATRSDPPTAPGMPTAAALTGVVLVVVLAAVALLWAKWLPYTAKAAGLGTSHHWSGSSILTVGGVRPGDAPTWAAATSFLSAYVTAVWKALLAALLISAAVQALVPTNWLVRLMNRRGRIGSAAMGGLLSTPSMMCTCCTAPVATTLRRNGVRTSAAVAYWLGNPLLNPAVLIFLVLVAPWQWTAVRLVVGIALVVGGAALVERLTTDRVALPVGADAVNLGPLDLPAVGAGAGGDVPTDARWLAGAPARFARTLARLLLTLVPEYLAVVLLIGAVRGWLFPLGDSSASWGVVVVLLAAVVGTAMVIPTAGEIPILQGLALAGLSLGGIGALLVTLPAVSLPGIAMVGKALGWRTTWMTAAVVVVGGVVAGGLLAVL